MNNLDSYRLSLRIAPHVLWGQTSRDSLFGSDILRKVRGSEICLWEQKSNYYSVIGNTLQR